MPNGTIVVTGASGFIAKHIIVELLHRGYAVRGTVRDLAKADAARAAIARAGANTDKLSFAAADLLADAGWDSALGSADAVLHTASPFPIQQPENDNDLLIPARDGTVRVLEAATRAGVKRAVVTSSTVAILYGSGLPDGHVYSEADFTDETRSELTAYIRSKTLAEKAAWDFVKRHGDAPRLTAINPGFVQGPALDGDLSTSHGLFQLMAQGLYPAAPKIRFPVVHVHDVAKAHATALENDATVGNRYLVADEALMSLYDLGRIMAELLPDLAGKAPRFELPDMVVRAMAVADKRLRTILPELGKVKQYSNAKARDGLGIEFVPGRSACEDSVRSLRELGLI